MSGGPSNTGPDPMASLPPPQGVFRWAYGLPPSLLGRPRPSPGNHRVLKISGAHPGGADNLPVPCPGNPDPPQPGQAFSSASGKPARKPLQNGWAHERPGRIPLAFFLSLTHLKQVIAGNSHSGLIGETLRAGSSLPPASPASPCLSLPEMAPGEQPAGGSAVVRSKDWRVPLDSDGFLKNFRMGHKGTGGGGGLPRFWFNACSSQLPAPRRPRYGCPP